MYFIISLVNTIMPDCLLVNFFLQRRKSQLYTKREKVTLCTCHHAVPRAYCPCRSLNKNYTTGKNDLLNVSRKPYVGLYKSVYKLYHVKNPLKNIELDHVTFNTKGFHPVLWHQKVNGTRERENSQGKASYFEGNPLPLCEYAAPEYLSVFWVLYFDMLSVTLLCSL